MIKLKHIVSTVSGKIFMLLLLSSPATVAVLALMGLTNDEVGGNILFGLLICSIPINISILVAERVKKGTQAIAKISWILLSLIILGVSLATIPDILMYAMITLCFPISIGAIYILYFLHTFPFYQTDSHFAYMFIAWLVFFVPGYLQWFKLIPYLHKRFWLSI